MRLNTNGYVRKHRVSAFAMLLLTCCLGHTPPPLQSQLDCQHAVKYLAASDSEKLLMLVQIDLIPDVYVAFALASLSTTSAGHKAAS